ncbi:RNA-directed DNA polymerase from mobile element jockey [Labeo rohita]|uniref:ribonuclease H n=1 Tax=Labeo rohita TaxID=84645 RepID=A0ABQ8M387_LABRO|nr:RNA-directed DNA polymerase from mobile element jockey [Labeo rohita]
MPSISADSVDLLLESFNSKVKNVIDDIAPVKVSKTTGRQKSCWRKSTAVQSMKRQCRKAERMWRKTKLEIHYSIYKDSLHAFNVELATARQKFFSNLINSNLNNTCTLFATVERLTKPPSQIPSEMLSDSKCNDFASFFSEKIINIRKVISTSSSYAEVRQIRPQFQKEVTLSVFEAIDSKTLEEIVQHLKSSTCNLDTLPTSFFKSVFNCLEADLLEVVNTSLLSGTFPNSLKTAVVKPLLKKSNLDNTILSNYRPISNLPFIGKIIEKVVFNQLNNYLNSNGYLDNFQSGFRPHHSTETALVKIINDIRLNSDSCKISVLVLLDLSAAFDTVDHNILLERLENWVGLSGMALSWFRSYLEGRGYYVSIGEHKSKWTSMTCGVPQGSILAPLLFSLYMLPLSQIMRKNQIAYHSYADDTQIYLALSPNDYSPIDSLCQCIDEINSWMCQNFLQLNKEKTEVIAFGSKEEVLKVNAYLDSRGQTTKNQVRNLGVILDQDLEKLVHAFITSRVDYCNGLLTGLPKKTIRQLQLVQNAAARILTRTRKSEHITPVLRSLHWLPRSMDQTLAGLPGVVCYLDDILVTGTDNESHLQNLDATLKRLKVYGLRSAVEYLGHVIDASGLYTSPSKSSSFKLLKPATLKETVLQQQKNLVLRRKLRAKDRTFSTGSSVLTRNYGRGPKWVPATVETQTGPMSYKVKTAGNLLWRRHTDQLLSGASTFTDLPEGTDVADQEGVNSPASVTITNESTKNPNSPSPKELSSPVVSTENGNLGGRRYPVREQRPPQRFLDYT